MINIKDFKFILVCVIILTTVVGLIWHPFVKTEIKTETRIDTSYVELPVEIIYKDKPIIKYVKDPKLIDSLEQYKQFYSNLLDSLEQGKIVKVSDTTKFTSGDSLITNYYYHPKNAFEFFFFPRPDKIITITNNITKTIDNTPLFTLYPSIGLSADFSQYYNTKNNELRQITNITPEIGLLLSFKNSSISPYARYQFNKTYAGGIAYKLKLF